MDDATTIAAPAHHHEGAATHDGHEPNHDLLYVKVAVGLAALTALEVVLSYLHIIKGLFLIIPLLVVMAIKFFIVGSFFMHLRFEKPVLNRIFYAGLFLAAAVYLTALSTFHFFRY